MYTGGIRKLSVYVCGTLFFYCLVLPVRRLHSSIYDTLYVYHRIRIRMWKYFIEWNSRRRSFCRSFFRTHCGAHTFRVASFCYVFLSLPSPLLLSADFPSLDLYIRILYFLYANILQQARVQQHVYVEQFSIKIFF